MSFVPNPAFAAAYLKSAEGKASLTEAAEACKSRAEVLAPIETGEYKNSFKVVDEEGEVRLANVDWKAWILEWGTEDTPVFATLRASVVSAGYRLGPPVINS